jgi:dTDP-4-dehydrorhamnose 3,5-epimerase
MKIFSTKFKGLKIIKLKKFKDLRGEVVKIFNKENSKINFNFSESYISISKKGAIRGLHGQIGKDSQSKIIFCVQGKFLDIAVDLRKNSKTYKKVFTKTINSKNSSILVIPEGFAHGIISLEDQTTLVNFNSKKYKPKKEFGININSLHLSLPKIKFYQSNKDKKLPKLNDFLKKNK